MAVPTAFPNAVAYALGIAGKTGCQLSFIGQQASTAAHHPMSERLQHQGRGQLLPARDVLSPLRQEGDEQAGLSDLLVVGAQDHSSGAGLLLADAWVHCPLLRIPERAHFEGLSTLTLATDFEEIGHKPSMGWLFRLAKAFAARLQIVYTGRRPRPARCFRQAMQQMGLADQLDAVRHTYHFIKSQELGSFLTDSGTHLLIAGQPTCSAQGLVPPFPWGKDFTLLMLPGKGLLRPTKALDGLLGSSRLDGVMRSNQRLLANGLP